MILCDTGPLVALIDRQDAHHLGCVESLASLPPVPLLTTWPCLTEAMHLLRRVGGYPAQEELWSFVADDLVRLHLPPREEWVRMRELMRQYSDIPMDLGDASLVALAEHSDQHRIFTLDSHFRAYRIHAKDAFQIVP